MAGSNELTYTFVAIDKFTSVADKISKSLDEFCSKTTFLSERLTQSSNNVVKTKSNLDSAVDSFNEASSAVSRSTSKVSEFTSNIKTSNVHLGSFVSKLDRWADKFGMSAYFKYMNIALPMLMIAKSGLDYEKSMDAASQSLKSMYGNVVNFKYMQDAMLKDAHKFQKIAPFSAAQYVAATKTMSNRLGSMQYGVEMMPLVMRYAAATGETGGDLSSIANKLASAVIKGQVGVFPISTANRKLLTKAMAIEGPAQSRIERFMKILPKIINDDVFKYQQQSSVVQLAILKNQIAEVNSHFMKALLPTFKKLAYYAQLYNNLMIPLIDKHKKITNVLGKLSIAGLGLVSSLIALGAVVGLISFAFKGLSAAMIFFKTVMLLTTRGMSFAMEAITGVAATAGMLGMAGGIGVAASGAFEGIKEIKKIRWSSLGKDLATVSEHPLQFMKYYFDMHKRSSYMDPSNPTNIQLHHHIKVEAPENMTVRHNTKISTPNVFNLGTNQGSFGHA